MDEQDFLDMLGLGVDYDDLNPAEQETYRKMLADIEQKDFTIEDFKSYVRQLIVDVSQDLSTYEKDSRKDLYLKARLRNLLMFDAMLTGKDKAIEEMKRQFQQMKNQKNRGDF